jgi:hypothetical protein
MMDLISKIKIKIRIGIGEIGRYCAFGLAFRERGEYDSGWDTGLLMVLYDTMIRHGYDGTSLDKWC